MDAGAGGAAAHLQARRRKVSHVAIVRVPGLSEPGTLNDKLFRKTDLPCYRRLDLAVAAEAADEEVAGVPASAPVASMIWKAVTAPLSGCPCVVFVTPVSRVMIVPLWCGTEQAAVRQEIW